MSEKCQKAAFGRVTCRSYQGKNVRFDDMRPGL